MTERRGRKELVELDRTLASVEDITPKLRADLTDLEPMAYERSVGERPERGSKKMGWAHTETGDPRAKLAMKELDKTAAAFLAAARKARNLFLGGPGPGEDMGSDLGEGRQGHGAEAELKRLLEYQRKRDEKLGIYTPNRLEPQPHVPGSRRR